LLPIDGGGFDMSHRLLRAAASSAALALAAGCTVHAQTEPVGYAEVTSAPTEIDAAPRSYYDGRVVYFHDDHWYYREGTRWRYYTQEPPELTRQRHYVQQAPPARRAYPAYPQPPGYPPPAPAPGYVPAPGNAPPPGYVPPPASAPPADRVR
jgi:hypothetical protein